MKTNPITALWHVLLTNCREASRLQSEALDRSLNFSESAGLRLHLVCCRWCRRYGRQLRFLRLAARQSEIASGVPPQGLSAEARERMKQAIRNAQG